MRTLLAHLTEAHRWRPEPIATESLVHLLGWPEARTALAGWADGLVPGLAAAELEYSGQAISGEAKGRPDVVGSTATEVRLVIEAKFAAQLTPAQATGEYLGHLGGLQPGLLVYLVPADRVVAMWSAAVKIHAGSKIDNPPEKPRCLLTPHGHVVTVLTWARLLDMLSESLAATPAATDVAQLRGLVDWCTATQWVPILGDDLSDRTGQQIAALGSLVQRAANQALQSKANPGNTDNGQGRYLVTAAGHQFWVGLWYSAWGAHGHSPVWAATEPAATTRETFATALAAGTGQPAFVHGKWVGVPLYLSPGDEEAVAEERLEADIVAFAQVLDAIGAPTAVVEQ